MIQLSQALVCVVLFWVTLRWISKFLYPSRLLPPGPKPLPLVGNLFDMPVDKPWVTYRNWCVTHGSDIIYVQLPMQPVIILGSVNAVMELLDKRSNKFSDRPRSIMGEILTWDFNFGMMAYGTRWRNHRRAFHQHFKEGVVDQYRQTQLRYVRAFLSWVLNSPKDTRKNVRRFTTSIIFSVVYGMEISGLDDKYVHFAEKASKGLEEALVPGKFWVEFLPFLRYLPGWLPGNSTKQMEREYKPYVEAMRREPYNFIKSETEQGRGVPSIAQTMVREIQSQQDVMTPAQLADEEELAMNTAAVSYAGATDTSTATLEAFLTAMALYPEVQKKAQAELDRVVGPNRLPDHNDIDSLVYTQAIMKEVLRWMPVFPLGVPHRSTEDDVYNGYFIPKGTMVIPNTRFMLFNPEDYPEPDRFNPDRYIGPDGKLDSNVLDPALLAFGYGRRVCPGRFFAPNEILAFIASVLHVFDIIPGVDEHGKPINISGDVRPGFMSGPVEVPCGLKPRSKRAEDLILEAAMESGEH